MQHHSTTPEFHGPRNQAMSCTHRVAIRCWIPYESPSSQYNGAVGCMQREGAHSYCPTHDRP